MLVLFHTNVTGLTQLIRFQFYTFQFWPNMLNVSMADIDNIEFDDNSTDINDTLHHMNEFLTKICQRQTAPEVNFSLKS